MRVQKAKLATSEINSASFLTGAYILAFTLIALFSIAGYFSLLSLIQNEKHNSTLINISGRQRRLSQSVALAALQLAVAKTKSEKNTARKELTEHVQLMQNSHEALTSKTGELGLSKIMSTGIEQIYFESPYRLDAEVKEYLRRAQHILAKPDEKLSLNDPDISFVLVEGPQNLVNHLDMVVKQAESDSQKEISRIEHMERIFLIVTLTLLFLEAAFIFFPMTKKIKKQIQDLLDSQRELNAVFNTVGDALMTMNANQEIVDVNKQVQTLWQIPRLEVIGKRFAELITKNKNDEISPDPFELGSPLEADALRKDGSNFPIELIVTKTDLTDRVLFTASVRDISDRKIAEKKMRDFYSTVSHELRSPLTSIKGSLRLLQGGAGGDLSVKAKKLIDIGVDDTDRLIRLLNNFLDLSKITEGMSSLNKKPEDISALARNAVTSMQSMAIGAETELEFKSEIEARVDCDSDRIIQVFTNLISNAVKFTKPDTKVIVAIDKSPNTDMVRCSVCDHGPGINADDISKLFGMFQQLDSTKSSTPGTGLGLAISKAIIEQHGGSISVSSEVGVGTTFWFDLEKIPQLNSHLPLQPLI